MLKHIYRIIILFCIFVAAIYYFSRDIKEVVFDIDNTTVMEEATFPFVTLKISDTNINLLHGYSNNLNANKIRDAVLPLYKDQSYEIEIDEKKFDIKKLNYEVREFAGNSLIEEDSVSVFDRKDTLKTAKIKFRTELTQGKEYAVKIILITSESKKLYFYHRIKVFDEAYLKEKLQFVFEFHNSIMDKNRAENIIKYLEPKREKDNSSFANVNIHSSFDLISWGELNPKIITNIIPKIKEIHVDTAIIELEYLIEVEIAGDIEVFRVDEFYRVRYTRDRMYLLNYDRSMEAVFDVKLTSLTKSQFKLGITSNLKVPYSTSADRNKIGFVRNRELYLYHLDTNDMIRVFSFQQENTDYIRDSYDQHDIKIVNIDSEGNMDFLVYGYMNRGQYEGKIALILYHYYRSENRIEEMIYIPVEEPYQILKENIGDLAYINSKDVFYIHIFNSIYSYDLITKKLKVIAVNIQPETIVMLEKLNYIAWQENPDPRTTNEIMIMNLETGDINSITSPKGYNIRLLDKIDNNIIYGFVKKGDISLYLDGSIIVPLEQVIISSVEGTILKNYSNKGYYVADIIVKDNVIELLRVQKEKKADKVTYITAPKDYIMNQIVKNNSIIDVTSRVTDKALTEWYLTLPVGFKMAEVPKVIEPISTVIVQDPTLRLPTSETMTELYYSYTKGEISGAYKEVVNAIKSANEKIGVVFSSKGQLIWERGVRNVKTILSDIERMDWTVTSTHSIESCMKLMLSYQGIDIALKRLEVNNDSIYNILSKYSKHSVIRLTGTNLDEMLYYVYRGSPVLAITKDNRAVIIYGYDAFNVMLVDPKTNQPIKMGIQDSAKMFEEAGNIFITYLMD